MNYRMKHMRRKSKRDGLILLIVLGMLALFSLLAVTYVVSAGASKQGSLSLRTKARNSNVTIHGASQSVVNALIRGTNDQTSSFYMNSLLGDIYSPNPLRTRFGHVLEGSLAFQSDWCRLLTSPIGPNLAKLSLRNVNVVNGPLSDYENEYNSRILTVLEGPLAGQSFRIIKYVGYVRGPNAAPVLPTNRDPNIQARIEATVPWTDPAYVDPLSYTVDYSVLIDMNDVKGTQFTGQFYNAAGVVETITLPLSGWISRFGVTSLFYLSNPSAGTYVGYSLLINDTAFNNAGIGINDVAEKIIPGPTRVPNPGFGTLDSTELMSIPSGSRAKVPPALLAHYDYLQKSAWMSTAAGQTGVPGIGVQTRTSINQNILNGATNEGFDVADWHDLWLAHQSFVNGRANIIPSFHRPEMVNYIANLFGNPASLSGGEVAEMLRLIDASSARILSYNFAGSAIANPNFRSNDQTYPRLPSTTWSAPPTTFEIIALQSYVAQLINGPWDVDNDRDGVPESVFTNPGLPIVYSPDGRMLRPLAAILVEDLDGRINVNTSGDRSEGLTLFDLSTNDRIHKTASNIRQGFGFGPADISLSSLFNNVGTLLRTSGASFSFFDDRYGARRYKRRPVNLMDISLDRVPGRRYLNGSFTGNDNFSQVFERESHVANSHGTLPGVPSGRRSNVGSIVDRNGNLAFVQQVTTDSDPYNPLAPGLTSEINDDPYEMAALEPANSDDPFGLTELQAILLRYEGDSNSMPRRLRERLEQIPGYNTMSDINRLITTRSAELRYPNLVAAMKTQAPFSTTELTVHSQAPSLQRWIQMLHAQRYQTRTLPRAAPILPQVFPVKAARDDPELTLRAIEELFPMEFSKGLRMDLNRPFGNGFDDDNDGQVDEPQELASGQLEYASDSAGNAISGVGDYHHEIQQTFGGTIGPGTRLRLGSRQILARNLYCLSQLIIPRNYVFPGMTTPIATPASAVIEMRNARIRATAIAQWAVNVVDFRDADIVNTRFEFDIMPFGTGTGKSLGLTERPAYWAPDHLNVAVNGKNNKDYVGVVWGMEMPELLLTESLALHDKRQRDTNLEVVPQFYDNPPGMGDRSFDQYRFPLASLFLELYCPRTTDKPFNDPNVANADLPQNVLLPGVPGRVSSLYTLDGSSKVALDLGKRAPASTSGSWGRQPVWRIAISEYDTVSAVADRHPHNLVMDLNKTSNLTHQTSTASNIAGVAWPPTAAPDQVTGSGLRYDLSDPADPSIIPFNPILPVAFDRFVWFTDVGPADAQDIPDLKSTLAPFQRQAVYYSRSGSQTLRGGEYLVVGPRAVTEFGSSTNSRTAPYTAWTPDIATDKPILSPSSQRISLAGNTVSTYMMHNVEANLPWTTMIKLPVSLLCAADPPRDSPTTINPTWNTAFPSGVGLNISFPNPYLTTAANPAPANPMWAAARAPTLRLNSSDAGGFAGIPPDSWIDVAGAAVTGNLPSDPYDDKPSSGTTLNTEIAKLGHDNPLGTYENVRAAYLQRLADPEFGYDPINNPYITVDWISMDLTVFNGEAPEHADFPAPKTTKLQSRYKDGKFATGAFTSDDGSTSGFSYHSPSTGSTANSLQQTPPPLLQHKSYFGHQLGYRTAVNWSGDVGSCGTTLGYVNAGFTTSGTPLTSVQMADPNCAVGQYTNQFDGFGPPVTNFSLAIVDKVSPAVQAAAKNITSPAWFNRSFASPHELILVPFTGPGQFGYYHSAYSGTQRKAFGFLPSFHATNPANTEEAVPANPSRSFWHTGTAVDESDMQFLLELVETPAPFADAHKVIRPDAINTLIANAAGSSPIDYVALRFLNSYVRPNYYAPSTFDMFRGPGLASPSNLLPTYVTAGKVNLNTVSELVSGDVPALKAIENNFLSPAQRLAQADPIQSQFIAARRGFALPTTGDSSFFTGVSFSNSGTLGVANDAMNVHYPTQFAGAFRPASTANIAPYVPNPEASARLRGKFGVETTLARSLTPYAPPIPTNLAATATDINSQAPMFADTSATNLATQNAFIRNQQAMRLPNLITNQSNVFAVWITVSLYEYDPITGFGNEYLDDLGEPKRERYFYIIDRSLPVGFKPGENLNTDRTILLHRKLD